MVVISHPTVQTSSTQQFFLATLKGEEAVTVRHLDEYGVKRTSFYKSNGRKSLARLPGQTPDSSIPDVLVSSAFCHEGMDRYGDE